MLFDFGAVTISLYGILIATGFLAAYSVSFFCAKKRGLVHHVDRVILWALLPGILFARSLFVLYHPDYFLSHLLEIPAVWHGGWVWHGALAGGLLGIFLYCKENKIAFLSLLDVCAPGVALGQSIGRWGNFFNQEAYGLPTNVPWGITIDPAHRLPGFEQFAVFHPAFLYESIFDFGLFLFLLFMVKYLSSLRRRDPRLLGDDTSYTGATFFLYLTLYSIGRFGIEFFRIDGVPIIMGLRSPQWISLGLIALGVAGLVWVLHKQKKLVY